MCRFRCSNAFVSSNSTKPPIFKETYLWLYLNWNDNKVNILTILKAHKPEFTKYGVSIIGLFDSYLRNGQSAKSDIDLLIDFEPEKENFDNYMAAYDIFENLLRMKKMKS